MKLDPLSITWVIVLAVAWSSARGDKVTFKETTTDEHPTEFGNGEVREDPSTEARQKINRTRQGKDLFDWIGLGTGHNVDPYLAGTNEACLNGDFAECFKSRALNTFSDFFDQQVYKLNEHISVIRMPKSIMREVEKQPYEYAGTAR